MIAHLGGSGSPAEWPPVVAEPATISATAYTFISECQYCSEQPRRGIWTACEANTAHQLQESSGAEAGSQLRGLDWPLPFASVREFRFAARCFIFSASFLDSRIVSAAFALARRLISRSSPVSAMLSELSFRLAPDSDAPKLNAQIETFIRDTDSDV